MNWCRTRAKKALIELYPSIISSEEIIFNFKEKEDKIYAKYTYQMIVFDKKDLAVYLNPIVKDGKYDEVTPELNLYLDEILKNKKYE